MYDSLKDKQVDDDLLALEELTPPPMPDPWDYDTKEGFVRACQIFEDDYAKYMEKKKALAMLQHIQEMESVEDIIEVEAIEAEKEGVVDEK